MACATDLMCVYVCVYVSGPVLSATGVTLHPECGPLPSPSANSLSPITLWWNSRSLGPCETSCHSGPQFPICNPRKAELGKVKCSSNVHSLGFSQSTSPPAHVCIMPYHHLLHPCSEDTLVCLGEWGHGGGFQALPRGFVPHPTDCLLLHSPPYPGLVVPGGEERPRTNDLMGTMGYLGHGARPQVSRIGQNKAVFQLPPKRATSAEWLRAKIYVKSLELIFSGWKPAGS